MPGIQRTVSYKERHEYVHAQNYINNYINYFNLKCIYTDLDTHNGSVIQIKGR